MSTWHEVKDKDDIDLSLDKEDLHILFDGDEWGNIYVSVPVKLVKEVLTELLEKEI